MSGVVISEQVDYDTQIKPLLSDRCYKCHGPDANQRAAGLRLDVEQEAKAERDRGLFAINPGNPDTSEIVRRVSSTDPDVRMPPPNSKLPVFSPMQVENIRQWIEAGAPWKSHWSFNQVRDVPVPDTRKSDWASNPIDRFVDARFQAANLSPSEPANKARLLRRVTFDLTGLPPTIEELRAFSNDTSPTAYERVVERLLKSQRFGERMAVPWLDAARYSDTYGYQVDRSRPMWRWRDWVIQAFNDNLPYDQFITWQVAGDLLTEPTDEQVLATAFNRLHPQKVEGGSTEEEFRTEYVADRTHTFATAFLGVTFECCRCHDHKYDPFTQKEYYQLFAFFNSIDEFGLYSYFTDSIPTPTLLLPAEGGTGQMTAMRQSVEQAEQNLARVRQQRYDAFEQWLKERPEVMDIPNLVAHFSFDQRQDNKYLNQVDPESLATTASANTAVDGRYGNAIQLTGDDAVNLPLGNYSRNEPFSVSLWLNTPNLMKRAVVFHRSRAWSDAGSRGYQLLLEDGRLSASLIHFWPGNAIRIRTPDALAVNKWHHVVMTYDGSSRADGLQLYVNGDRQSCEVVRDSLYKNIMGGGGDNITIGERMRDRGFTHGMVDEFRVYDRRLTALEIAAIGQNQDSLTTTSQSDLTKRLREQLFEYYLSTVDQLYRQQLDQLKEARAAHSKAVDGIDEIMVMRDRPRVRQTHVLVRGAYDAPGEIVRPNTPAILNPFPQGQPRNRRGLANWLTSPENPLTARVAINRFWQMFFGEGLVRTPEDFGSQGELPTHPKLLDWLAKDFMDHGWNTKRLVKQIVTSATYRQDSQTSVELLSRDPENRWLARGPRFRLPAEMIRDNALFLGGLLVEKIGGPAVRPYDLAVSFKPLDPDKGEGLYRRSLYTFWKRTGPAPMMMAFDASKRDVCTVKRERTSTPLQALVLLNAPQFVEGARGVAEQLLRKHGLDIDQVVAECFELATSRAPGQDELKVLRTLYVEQKEHFVLHPKQAEEFLNVGECSRDQSLALADLAAATVLAKAILSFDESVVLR